ncbi:MAG: indolepyruvate ferredoxin oxidoreductase subunit alpha [Peptococcaceae bacterium]|jgi:indolepyruvate ferredoxin oxidoreductase alpha subunit|nr:indolepyruvate ferredoxin oxidoreductase subunit alpha [Peptococcaceae bacterium]MDH7524483.1 indolepyruvate ferredoxin oxidoreductase subunit alpha [Peptococcaceae bacterium]
MKTIMSGNEAVARGAYEAGCSVAAAYPGTPSTEILESTAAYKEIYSEWSTNEKVALEIACGASIAGARALAAMKHVGLNVAADPMFTAAYTGVNGGLVIVTADDPGCHSSQNEQDNRNYAPFAKVPMLEPSDSQECKDYLKLAFELSERFDTPVLLRMTTRVCHSKGLVELGERVEAGVKEYKKDAAKYVMAPANARARRAILEERLGRLREYADTCPCNRIEWGDKRIGIITSGISYQHAREVFGEGASYLKLGLTYPLPDRLIRKFAGEVGKVYVIEENDPYLETHVRSLGVECLGKEVLPACGELSPEVIRKALLPAAGENGYSVEAEAPSRPPVLCAGCPHRGLYYALSKRRDVVVAGDIGCYTLGAMPPLSVTDTVICMGAGISAAVGMEKAFKKAGRKSKVIGCIGDSTFFHSGITGLIDAVYNKSSVAICILDNRTTAMTGHQENPGTGKTLMGEDVPVIEIEKIVKAVGIKEENIRVITPYDLVQTEKAVREACEATEPFVIISREPCALLKEVQKERRGRRCEIDTEKCKKCKACLKIGCPALVFKEGQVVIDGSMCNGCTLCLQVCRFDAVKKVGD